MIGNCGRCQFCETGPTGGSCHKNAPAVVVAPVVGGLLISGQREQGLKVLGLFPPVDPEQGWCGSFEPREGEKA